MIYEDDNQPQPTPLTDPVKPAEPLPHDAEQP